MYQILKMCFQRTTNFLWYICIAWIVFIIVFFSPNYVWAHRILFGVKLICLKERKENWIPCFWRLNHFYVYIFALIKRILLNIFRHRGFGTRTERKRKKRKKRKRRKKRKCTEGFMGYNLRCNIHSFCLFLSFWNTTCTYPSHIYQLDLVILNISDLLVLHIAFGYKYSKKVNKFAF